MTVGYADFIADYPEFSNTQRYPASWVNYWGAVANLLLNNPGSASFWGRTPGGFIAAPQALILSSISGGALAAATYYGIGTYVTRIGETIGSPEGSRLVAANNLLSAVSPPGGAVGIIGWNFYAATASGEEILQNTLPIPIGTAWTEPTSGLLITGAAPPSINTSGAKALIDIGVELFVAHNLALEVQSADAAALNAVPGTVGGPIVARAANGISVNYDGSGAIEKDAGHWNLTTYGRRFIGLARMVGTVPLQIGIGFDPTGGMNGPGWSGPPPWVIGSPGSAVY